MVSDFDPVDPPGSRVRRGSNRNVSYSPSLPSPRFRLPLGGLTLFRFPRSRHFSISPCAISLPLMIEPCPVIGFPLLVEADYTVIFFAAGARHNPGWSWVWKAYRSLNRKYRKNLKKLVSSTRSVLTFARSCDPGVAKRAAGGSFFFSSFLGVELGRVERDAWLRALGLTSAAYKHQLD